MASRRTVVKTVQAVAQAGSECHYLGLYVPAKDAEKLLTRQHAKFVDLVKQERLAWKASETLDLFVRDLLAALQQGGKP